MFWTFVGALLFVLYVFPVIIRIILSLFFSLDNKKIDKNSIAKEQTSTNTSETLNEVEAIYNKQQENIKKGLTFDGKKI